MWGGASAKALEWSHICYLSTLLSYIFIVTFVVSYSVSLPLCKRLTLVCFCHAGFVRVDWRSSSTLHGILWRGKEELLHVISFLPSFLFFFLSLISKPSNFGVWSFYSALICLCSRCLQKLGYALDPDGPRFAKMEDLIRHYYNSNLPKCDVKLKKPYK